MNTNGCLIFLMIFVLLITLVSCSGGDRMVPIPCPEISDQEIAYDTESLVAGSYSDNELFTTASENHTSEKTIFEIYYPFFNDQVLDHEITFNVVDPAIALSGYDRITVDYIYNESHGISSFLFCTEGITGNDTVYKTITSLNFDNESKKLLSITDCFGEDNADLSAIPGIDESTYFYIDKNDVKVYTSDGKHTLPSSSLKNLAEREKQKLINYNPVTDLNEKVIAITFDDGPSAITTPVLCDMLLEKGVKATIFVLGVNLDGSTRNQATLKKLVENGNEIGIHSYSHPNFHLLSLSEISYEIERTQTLIYNATGIKSTLVRPPYGNMKKEVAQALDYFIIRWSIDPEDWKDRTAQQIADSILQGAKSGEIILLHDIYSRSVEAAEIVIDTLLAEGYRFVTISELYDLKDKTPDGRQYFNIHDR